VQLCVVATAVVSPAHAFAGNFLVIGRVVKIVVALLRPRAGVELVAEFVDFRLAREEDQDGPGRELLVDQSSLLQRFLEIRLAQRRLAREVDGHGELPCGDVDDWGRRVEDFEEGGLRGQRRRHDHKFQRPHRARAAGLLERAPP